MLDDLTEERYAACAAELARLRSSRSPMRTHDIEVLLGRYGFTGRMANSNHMLFKHAVYPGVIVGIVRNTNKTDAHFYAIDACRNVLDRRIQEIRTRNKSNVVAPPEPKPAPADIDILEHCPPGLEALPLPDDDGGTSGLILLRSAARPAIGAPLYRFCRAETLNAAAGHLREDEAALNGLLAQAEALETKVSQTPDGHLVLVHDYYACECRVAPFDGEADPFVVDGIKAFVGEIRTLDEAFGVFKQSLDAKLSNRREATVNGERIVTCVHSNWMDGTRHNVSYRLSPAGRISRDDVARIQDECWAHTMDRLPRNMKAAYGFGYRLDKSGALTLFHPFFPDLRHAIPEWRILENATLAGVANDPSCIHDPDRMDDQVVDLIAARERAWCGIERLTEEASRRISEMQMVLDDIDRRLLRARIPVVPLGRIEPGEPYTAAIRDARCGDITFRQIRVKNDPKGHPIVLVEQAGLDRIRQALDALERRQPFAVARFATAAGPAPADPLSSIIEKELRRREEELRRRELFPGAAPG